MAVMNTVLPLFTVCQYSFAVKKLSLVHLFFSGAFFDRCNSYIKAVVLSEAVFLPIHIDLSDYISYAKATFYFQFLSVNID